jgi:biotin carboxyl carrier protein
MNDGTQRAVRYHASIRGQRPMEIELQPMGEGRFVLTLGDRRHQVDALRLSDGALSILVDGQSHTVEFEELGDEMLLSMRNQQIGVDVVDERRFRLRASSATSSPKGKQLVMAPMPGKIVHVLVRLGDQVQEGQALVVIEAMKMENELKSPKAGKVAEILAIEGSAVEKNAKLMVVE